MARDTMTQERMGLTDYFEQTWKAREKLLDAAEKLTPEEWEREFEFSWKSMQLLFAHIIEVERSWMLEDIRGKKYDAEPQAVIQSRYATRALTRAQGREVADITRSVLAEYASAAKMQDSEVHLGNGAMVRDGVLFDRAGKRLAMERPHQVFSRWYGFALTFPGCEVFGQ